MPNWLFALPNAACNILWVCHTINGETECMFFAGLTDENGRSKTAQRYSGHCDVPAQGAKTENFRR